MPDIKRQEQWDKEFNEEWMDYWIPLITNDDGYLDPQKIKNEMQDLIFIYKQVAEVYCYITGNQLSKAMYYANVITTAYDDELNKLLREDRARIVKYLRKVMKLETEDNNESYEITSTRFIHLEDEEIDDLIDKIMED
jgi:hypothetical protein